MGDELSSCTSKLTVIVRRSLDYHKNHKILPQKQSKIFLHKWCVLPNKPSWQQAWVCPYWWFWRPVVRSPVVRQLPSCVGCLKAFITCNLGTHLRWPRRDKTKAQNKKKHTNATTNIKTLPQIYKRIMYYDRKLFPTLFRLTMYDTLNRVFF